MVKSLIITFLITTSCYASPLKIGVVDTGLNIFDKRLNTHLCKTNEHKDFTTEGLYDYEGHGTQIVSLIENYAKNTNYCIVILKYYSQKINNTNSFYNAIKEAVRIKCDIVNISGGGEFPNEKEQKLIENSKNIMFIVASGNKGLNLDISKEKFYPASYKLYNNLNNLYVVGSINNYGEKSYFTNYGSMVEYWEVGENVPVLIPDNKSSTMSGTSASCAIHTGKVINRFYKRKLNYDK